jgi:hypothetical protein
MSEILNRKTTSPQSLTIVRGERGDRSDGNIQSGIFETAIALSALRMIVLESGQWIYASSDQESHGNAAIGLLLTGQSQGSLCNALLQGLATDLGWNWAANQPVFLGLNGMLTQSQPATGFRRIVGFAASPTQLLINPQEAIFL